MRSSIGFWAGAAKDHVEPVTLAQLEGLLPLVFLDLDGALPRAALDLDVADLAVWADREEVESRPVGEAGGACLRGL